MTQNKVNNGGITQVGFHVIVCGAPNRLTVWHSSPEPARISYVVNGGVLKNAPEGCLNRTSVFRLRRWLGRFLRETEGGGRCHSYCFGVRIGVHDVRRLLAKGWSRKHFQKQFPRTHTHTQPDENYRWQECSESYVWANDINISKKLPTKMLWPS